MTDRQEIAAGLLVVDKPGGMTSHDVVARVRRLAGTRRVGHAGTLDPMATGVLIVGVGQATRLLGHLAAGDKDYLATVRLGATTTTDDADGEPVSQADPAAVAAIEDDEVLAAMADLTGPIQQVPPAVSAVKVAGVRSYARARAGKPVALAPRAVNVAEFRLIRKDGADLEVAVTCSTGTYIRSLARDLGAALDVGAHLVGLRRTRVGGFTDRNAVALDELQPERDLLPIDVVAAAAFDTLRLSPDEAGRVRHGQRRVVADQVVNSERPVALLDETGGLVALADVRDGVAHPLAVFG